jgi:Caspase domain
MANGYYLIIGINAPIISNSAQLNALKFAEKSAEDVKTFLDTRNFKKSTALLGKKATKSKVLARSKSLAKKVKKEDLLVIFYCGHGRQMGNLAGFGEPTTAEDNLNETWVLHDEDLIDDEINEVLSNFTTYPRILVISDSCFSAGILPFILPFDLAKMEEMQKADVPFNTNLTQILELIKIKPINAQLTQTSTETVLKKARLLENWKVIFIAASGETERAREYTGLESSPKSTYFTNAIFKAMEIDAAMENYPAFFNQIKTNIFNITGNFNPEIKLFGLQSTDVFPQQKPFTI